MIQKSYLSWANAASYINLKVSQKKTIIVIYIYLNIYNISTRHVCMSASYHSKSVELLEQRIPFLSACIASMHKHREWIMCESFRSNNQNHA